MRGRKRKINYRVANWRGIPPRRESLILCRLILLCRIRRVEITLAFLLIAFDRILKLWALHGGIAIINKGIGLGILFPFDFAQGRHGFIASLFLIFLILALAIWLYFKRSQSPALLFVITGGISNLLDRLFYGGVVDFITFPFMPIFIRNQALLIFNMADILVMIGFVLIFIDLLKSKTVS